jgi:hypothetical protein
MKCRQRIALTPADAANFALGGAPLQRLAIRFADCTLSADDAGGGTAGDPFAADEGGNRRGVFGLRHGLGSPGLSCCLGRATS